MSPLAVVVGSSPRALSMRRALENAQWRALGAATVFDAIKLLGQKPVAIVCDATVGELKLRKLLSDPSCAPGSVYALDGRPSGTTSLAGLDDVRAAATLVERHGGKLPAPRPKVPTQHFEPLEIWWTDESGQPLLHAELKTDEVEVRHLFLERANRAIGLHHPMLPPLVTLDEGDAVHATWEVPRGAQLSSIGRLLHSERTLLSLETVCTLATQLAGALERLHASKQLHGMVRPWSVWVSDEGELRLLFALVGQLTELDRTRQRRGTNRLAPRVDDLSPEQVRGTATSVATDLYQLGHLLFEELTGRSPFGGGDLRAITEGARPRLNDAGLPEAIAQLVPQLLSVDPKQRPGAAQVQQAAAPHQGDAGAVRGELSRWVRRFHDELEGPPRGD